MINILIVDDEENICTFIEAYLKKEGYNTFTANNGSSAIDIFESNDIDLVILDRMIPDISGEEICSHIRTQSNVPIIMLTAKTELDDKIYGFEIGCDDYICKPFSPKELIVRVKAIIKRSNISANIIQYSNELIMNQDSRSVIVRGNEIILTNTEYKILSLMALNPEKIYTRENILESALDDFYDKFDRVVDSHIKNLRQKIEEDSKKPKIIKTIYGVGYKFGLQKK